MFTFNVTQNFCNKRMYFKLSTKKTHKYKTSLKKKKTRKINNIHDRHDKTK